MNTIFFINAVTDKWDFDAMDYRRENLRTEFTREDAERWCEKNANGRQLEIKAVKVQGGVKDFK